MSFRFQPDEPTLTATLHRLAFGELGAALAQLPVDGTPGAGSVHDIRKRIKKLRALLRLLRPGLRPYAVENAALRDAAQSLSSMRDSAVRLATFDALVPDPTGPFLALRALLASDAASATSGPAPVAETRALLAAVQSRIPSWQLSGRDRAILSKGLATTRSRARKAMAAAQAGPTIEAMHDWRKRAKDVWYQARLFAPVWPEAIAPLAATASDLTEDLGRHHDLAMLAAYLAGLRPTSTPARAAPHLRTLIHAAQVKIEDQAFPRGARLLAGEPKAMANLWVDWWRAWHD